eukprot:snap_masked-scaffold_27-processed-gene-2.21-mRNA-1 protein AED:0.02 eAED:0.02 QI:0/-1/0/1/-1/1/1/0/497
MKIVVLVLGDVGRSPRMQYHASSLSKLNNIEEVYLVGYHGETCFECVTSSPKISLRQFTRPITKKLGLSRSFLLFYAPFQIFQQVFQLFYTLLFTLTDYDVVLVQNPPSIPTLSVLSLVSLLNESQIIIDWHNLGYSVLQNSFPSELSVLQRLIVNISLTVEKVFGKVGTKHLTVTKALKKYLANSFKLKEEDITVLYDKPPEQFRPSSLFEKHRLFYKLSDELLSREERDNYSYKETYFTNADESKTVPKIQEKKTRPFLIVSSTSYTPDEDFSVLLDALVLLDESLEKEASLLKHYENDLVVLCLVTGKGPLKDFFASRIEKFNRSHPRVRVAQLWLEPEDYPILVGCADLGVCLHDSTSGLDLPMKVVDMFGAKLPVCAVDYPCLNELVQDGVNGKVFKNCIDLFKQIKFFIISDEGTKTFTMLNRLKAGIPSESWDKEWKSKLPSLLEAIAEFDDKAIRTGDFFLCTCLFCVIYFIALSLGKYFDQENVITVK